MNAKKQKANDEKLTTILVVAGLLLAISAILGFVFQDKIKTATTDVTARAENSGKPKFVFDTAKFPDWASFGNTWQGADTIAAIGISQCAEDSACASLVEKCRVRMDKSNQSCKELEQYTADSCMVQAYYFSGLIDPDTAVADAQKQLSDFGNIPKEVSVKTLAMSTLEGAKEYQFYQYDTNNNQGEYKRGVAFGFIPLDNGHIEVRSTCWEARQLNDTLPVIKALRFEA